MTDPLILRAAAACDDRASAAFGVPEDATPDAVVALGEDGEDSLRKLLVGTDLDLDEVETFLGGLSEKALEGVISMPPHYVGIVVVGYLRTALLTGYHARRLQEEEAAR